MNPIRRIKRISVASQTGLIILVMLIATVVVLLTWATNNAVSAELKHAQTVADMADSFREVSSSYGGFYVRRNSSDPETQVGRYLAQYRSEQNPDGSIYFFHQKNPFLALADYSDAIQKSPAAAKFRLTSDNYMNPSNSPDLFDLESIKLMRETGGKEHWRVEGNTFRYSRALVATESCLKCHGSAEAAPLAVKSRYKGVPGNAKAGGYGYSVGEVVGVTSVSVPHMTPGIMLLSQSIVFYLASAVVIAMMACTYLLTQKLVVKPLGELSKYAQCIAEADSIEKLNSLHVPRFDAEEHTSNNEIHREAHAVKSLHESMWAAMSFIAKSGNKFKG